MNGSTAPIANNAQASSPTHRDQPARGRFALRSINTPRSERAGGDHRQAEDGAEDHDPRASDAAILERRVGADLMGEEEAGRARAQGRPRA